MIRTITETLVAIGDSNELMLVLKATVAICLGLAINSAARTASASLRHLVLLVTFAAIIALPIAMLLVPPVGFQVQSAPPVPARRVFASASQELVNLNAALPSARLSNSKVVTFSPRLILLSLWGLGSALFAVPFVGGLWKLRRIRQAGLPWHEADGLLCDLTETAGIKRRIDILLHDDMVVPVTSGLLRPAILLPAEARTWSEPDLLRVLVHELEHIRRFDWMVHISSRAVCSAYWFHPLVWIAWRRMTLEAERACDDAVVARSERTDYAEQLVSLARRLSNALAPPVLSMANRSDLSTRVSAILDRNQSRARAGLVLTAAVLMIAIGLVLGIAPVRAVSGSAGQSQLAAQKSKSTQSPAQKALNRALLEAAEANQIEDMVKLLDSGADINGVIDGDGTPLIAAAREGHIPAAKLLIDRGADVNAAVEGDGNPIIAAAAAGHEKIVELLLNFGASIDRVVPGDENALIQASGSGHIGIVKLLVSRGADVNAHVWVNERNREGEWRTPLSEARKSHHTAVIEFLISVGARE